MTSQNISISSTDGTRTDGPDGPEKIPFVLEEFLMLKLLML